MSNHYYQSADGRWEQIPHSAYERMKAFGVPVHAGEFAPAPAKRKQAGVATMGSHKQEKKRQARYKKQNAA